MILRHGMLVCLPPLTKRGKPIFGTIDGFPFCDRHSQEKLPGGDLIVRESATTIRTT